MTEIQTTEIQTTEDIQTSPIPGIKVLLQGESGSGKTHALRSLIQAGIKPLMVMTDPSLSTLADLPCTQWHYMYVPPVAFDFADMIGTAEKINVLSFDSLAKMTDPNRAKNRQWISLLTALHKFKCDRCGAEFGDATSWGTGKALYLDSMSGLNPMALSLVAGDKPVKAMADWQIAQGEILKLIQKITAGCRCHVVLTAHIERETDEITGGVQLMAATLGRKLAPQIPRFFDEVIHTVRNGDKFLWSTATSNMAVKTRLLQRRCDLTPSFVPLIDEWKKRGGFVEIK